MSEFPFARAATAVTIPARPNVTLELGAATAEILRSLVYLHVAGPGTGPRAHFDAINDALIAAGVGPVGHLHQIGTPELFRCRA